MPKFDSKNFDKSPRRQKLFFENIELPDVDEDFLESLQEENEDIDLNNYL